MVDFGKRRKQIAIKVKLKQIGIKREVTQWELDSESQSKDIEESKSEDNEQKLDERVPTDAADDLNKNDVD